MDEYVICMVCGNHYKQINIPHLRTHGITIEEYKERYPHAELTSTTTRKRQSEKAIEYNKEHPEFKRDNAEKRKRCYETHPEKRDEASERVRQYHIDHPEAREHASIKAKEQWIKPEAREAASIRFKEYHKNHPEAREEQSKKISQWRDENPHLVEQINKKHRDRHVGHPEIGKAHGKKLKRWYEDHPEAKERARRKTIMQFESQEARDIARKNAMIQWNNPAARNAARTRALNQKPVFYDTKIELKMQDILSKNGYVFGTHETILNICKPDIVFGDRCIAVFCDGDYWHNRPDAIIRDKNQNKVLLENGWIPLRFWEHEINDNIDDCLYRFELEYFGGEC